MVHYRLAGRYVGRALERSDSARYPPTGVRGIVYPFKSYDALSLLMEAGGDEQDLELPCGEGFRDGEWVLSTITVGDDSIAVAACVVDRGDGLRLAFKSRDWEQLWQFANADGPPTPPPPSLPQSMPHVHPPPDARVLIIDDDPDLQHVVSRMLDGDGFSVCAVSSAEEAFDHLRAESADLLVIDWNLPGMTGIEFCRRLKAERSWARLPVLFLTAHSSSQDIVEAFDAGADDFVSKPFRARELAARVHGLLRRAQMAPPSRR